MREPTVGWTKAPLPSVAADSCESASSAAPDRPIDTALSVLAPACAPPTEVPAACAP